MFFAFFVNIPIQKVWIFFIFLNIHNTYSFDLFWKIQCFLPYSYIKLGVCSTVIHMIVG